jgi:hypothetical protein
MSAAVRDTAVTVRDLPCKLRQISIGPARLRFALIGKQNLD